jgi:antitoxin (DNA-binding transcriptional repressor) of toxin-antitoxin stability system
MAVIEIDVEQGEFAEAVAAVEDGNEVVLLKQGQPVARLLPMKARAAVLLGPRKAGSAQGLFTVPDDFDEPLDDFRDYM